MAAMTQSIVFGDTFLTNHHFLQFAKAKICIFQIFVVTSTNYPKRDLSKLRPHSCANDNLFIEKYCLCEHRRYFFDKNFVYSKYLLYLCTEFWFASRILIKYKTKNYESEMDKSGG